MENIIELNGNIRFSTSLDGDSAEAINASVFYE